MSDVVLHWMINEVKKVGELYDGQHALKWSERCDGFEKYFAKNKESEAFKAKAHDNMKISGGCGLTKVFFWRFLGKFSR